MNVVEWFGGIGAFTNALKKVKIEYTLVDYVDLDKQAVNAFNALNNTNYLPQDIKDVNTDSYGEIDILIAGWPCQDYSVAGKGLGTFKGTRSNLILATIDKISQMKNKPKYILLENVKGILQKKHIQDLEYIKEQFRDLGYKWNQVLLNAKYFDIPQNRERVYCLLVRNNLANIDILHLEEKQEVNKVLKHFLDFNEPVHFIDLKNIQICNNFGFFVNEMSQYNKKIVKVDLDKLCNQKKDQINKVAVLGTFKNAQFKEHSFRRKNPFLGVNGIATTLRAGDCDAENKVIFQQESFNQDINYHGIEGQGNTLVSNSPDFKNKIMFSTKNKLFYRKLTPKECWRLMGFSDEDFHKVDSLTYKLKNGKTRKLVSNSALCKLAGNSIVVNVLEAIIKAVWIQKRKPKQISLFENKEI